MLAALVLADRPANAAVYLDVDQARAAPDLTSRAADNPARLIVTVQDSHGVIPGAAVTVVSDGASPTYDGITDAAGRHVFEALPPGTYHIVASFGGFADVRQDDLRLAGGEERSVNLTLTLVQFSSQVTVSTANRREQLLLDVAEPTVLFDSGQIADTAARTAKDLLIEQSGAGIQVNAGGGQGYLSLNGIPNSGVLVLIDGRRYLGKDANGNFNLEDLSLAGIERVEVVKGAGSALYGSDALGGVINFITRRSKQRGLSNTIDFSGGSYGDVRISDVSGWRSARGGLSGTLGYRTYDGFDLSEANPQTIGQPESAWWNGGIAGDVRVTQKAMARVNADYSRRDIEKYFFSGATQLASTVYNSQRELTRVSVSPGLDYQFAPRTSVSVDYTHGRYRRDETRIFTVSGNIEPQALWREWNDEIKVVGRHTWSIQGRELPLQIGLERRQERLRRATLTVAEPERDINIFWFQQEARVIPRLTVAGGARFDDYSDFGREWSPKASAVYALSERQRLHTSAGHGFRPPYFGELYLNTPPSFVGNPNLRPEIANTFNAGYSWSDSRIQVSGDYFQARVKDGIAFDLSRQPFTYANFRAYTSKGTNLSASFTLPGSFTPSVSYTYNTREDDRGVEIGGYAKHATFVKLLWTQTQLGLRANLRGQILGRVPPSTDGTYQPGYEVWYAQLAKRLATRGGDAISVYVQVANLFDERDLFRRSASGDPIAGDFQVWIAPRTFLAGLTLDLDWTR